MADQRLLELFDARQVGGVVPDAAAPRGLGVDSAGEVFFADPDVAAERAAQAGGRRLRRKVRGRRKTQRGGKRKSGKGRNRSTFRLNLRAQIRLRSRSQRRH